MEDSKKNTNEFISLETFTSLLSFERKKTIEGNKIKSVSNYSDCNLSNIIFFSIYFN